MRGIERAERDREKERERERQREREGVCPAWKTSNGGTRQAFSFGRRADIVGLGNLKTVEGGNATRNKECRLADQAT